MDRVGVLVVSKCLSSAAIVDTFLRSEKYRPEFYIVEKQANPFNVERAKEHRVIPDLRIAEIVKFAKRFAKRVAFGLCDTEDFVVAGGRDQLEREAGVPMVCVTKKYALEGSKAAQRLLFDEICPAANPRFRIFDPTKYSNQREAVEDLRAAIRQMQQPVIKPDAPARGAGVGVWGSDFRTQREAELFFLNVYSKGRVVVEERIEGEESSFHAFCDGRHFCVAPLTRDYKRALNGNRGRLTGGMGSYRDAAERLPFITDAEWSEVINTEEDAFKRWRGRGSNPELRGIVEYDALMHTGSGFKILERNSRGGNTESINLFATLEDDLADVCFRMIEGSLRRLRFRNQASVVTCVVPRVYGTSENSGSSEGEIGLTHAYELQRQHDQEMRVYPMDIRIEDGRTMHGSSRCVAVVGIGDDIAEARGFSLTAAGPITGDLRHRTDIASKEDLLMSCNHMGALRAGQSGGNRWIRQGRTH
jgi:phosphoribosylamine-glycine ligase